MKIIDTRHHPQVDYISQARNYKIEQRTWYDYHCLVTDGRLDPTHDHELIVDFTLEDDYPTTNEPDEYPVIFHALDSNCILSLVLRNYPAFEPPRVSIQYTAGLFYNKAQESTGNTALAQHLTSLSAGRHVVVLRAVGDTFMASLDGQPWLSVNGLTRRTGTAWMQPYTSKHIGDILNIQHTDLTTGQVLWAYPAIAEQYNLVKLVNIDTTSDCFKAIDAAQLSYVDTVIDLNETPAEHTTILCARIGNASGEDARIFGQGNVKYASDTTIGFMFARSASKIQINIGLRDKDNKAIHITFNQVLDITQYHVYAITISASYGYAKLYIDGVLIATSDLPKSGSVFAYSNATAIKTPIQIITQRGVSQAQVRYVLMYNSALFDEEITHHCKALVGELTL